MNTHHLLKPIFTRLQQAGLATPLLRQGIGGSARRDPEILAPRKIKTSIGTLNFFDEVPTRRTAESIQNHLDLMRGVDAFLKGMPGVTMIQLRDTQRRVRAPSSLQSSIFFKMSQTDWPLRLPRASRYHAISFLDLRRDGPVIVELPSGMLGVFKDMWFQFVEDVGVAGVDQGRGGRYLVLPPAYEGHVPDDHFIVRPKTYGVWLLLRGSVRRTPVRPSDIAKGKLKIYPLRHHGRAQPAEFIDSAALANKTRIPRDLKFYEDLDRLVQEEPANAMDLARHDLFASIGISKDRPFRPNLRMQRILTDAAKIGRATIRTMTHFPRESEPPLDPAAAEAI